MHSQSLFSEIAGRRRALCADWVLSVRSSLQEVQATGELQATLSSAHGSLWNIRLNSHRDDICFDSGYTCYWQACFKWMASVAFFTERCRKMWREAQFSFPTSGFLQAWTAGSAFTPKPQEQVFSFSGREGLPAICSHLCWRATLCALLTHCRSSLNLASTALRFSHLEGKSQEGWVPLLGTSRLQCHSSMPLGRQQQETCCTSTTEELGLFSEEVGKNDCAVAQFCTRLCYSLVHLGITGRIKDLFSCWLHLVWRQLMPTWQSSVIHQNLHRLAGWATSCILFPDALGPGTQQVLFFAQS